MAGLWQGMAAPPVASPAPWCWKLKTADFRSLTRSLTGAEPPTSEQALADIAYSLRARVDLPVQTRYRLVGVGLSGFAGADGSPAQEDLFLSATPA